jgi:hypothetical protein
MVMNTKYAMKMAANIALLCDIRGQSPAGQTGHAEPGAPTQIHCSKCPDVTVPPVMAVAETVKALVAAFAVKSVMTQRGATPNDRENVTAIAVDVVVHPPTLSLDPATRVHVVVAGGAAFCGEPTQWPCHVARSGMVKPCATAIESAPANASPESKPPQKSKARLSIFILQSWYRHCA